MTNHVDSVFRIVHVNPKLLIELANRRLFGGLAGLHLSARKRKLTTVDATLCSFDQEHLAVERVHIASAGCWRRPTCPCLRRRDDERRDRSLTIVRDRGGIGLNRFKARQSTGNDGFRQWNWERSERTELIARQRVTESSNESIEMFAQLTVPSSSSRLR